MPLYIAALLAAIALFYAAVSLYSAGRLTRAKRVPVTTTPAEVGLEYREVSFPSQGDGLTLRGWLLPSPGEKGAVIMVHGSDGNRADPSINTLGLSRDLVENGYSVLLFDLRAHGESEGQRRGLGETEARDVLGAVNFLRGQGMAPDRIAVLGFSLGGAASILASAQDGSIRALVADSAFASLSDITRRQFQERSPLPLIFLPGIRLAARLLYGTDPAAVAPEQSLSRLHLPVLLIHGGQDDVVPPEHARRLLAASPHPGTRLWLVPEAGHVGSYLARPQEYVAQVVAYLDQRLGEGR